VYQGKNSENIGIPHEITNLPTMEKTAVNTIIHGILGKKLNGMLWLFMDNRTSCASLCVLLHEKFDIHFAGTTCVNWHGSLKNFMALSKSAPSRMTIRSHDDKNKISCL
jgi:hypothetical protein